MRRFLAVASLLLATTLFPATADAVPLLQLDMLNGIYDPVDETIVASGGGQFTLFAILTPKVGTGEKQIANLVNGEYFVSIALTPKTGPTNQDLGSFTLTAPEQKTVDVTADMTYGAAPLETVAALQQFDSHDLPKHGIFQTFFIEVPITFANATRATTYNTADDPGGPTNNAAGGSYYVTIAGDASRLNAGFDLHFDLYHKEVKTWGTLEDVDVNKFAPFSHDAATRVPEPATALLLFTGVAAVLAGSRRRTL